MKQMRVGMLACVALSIGACASSPSQPNPRSTTGGKLADLSGSWVLTTESRVGAQDAQMTIRQTGNALTGTITADARTVDYTGSVNGSAVAFDFTLEIHGTNMQFDYTGTLEGNTIKGRAVFGQFGEGTFIARRQ